MTASRMPATHTCQQKTRKRTNIKTISLSILKVGNPVNIKILNTFTHLVIYIYFFIDLP